MRQTAPWPDFDGNPIMEGDRMVHPSGECGIVVLCSDAPDDSARWRVDYSGGISRSLSAEVSRDGRCVVIDETGKTF
ncbi:hypothetical protein [Uliginosibacterium aquaticum]|uniref:Uncharacterized protein n=1 Tax=Uliginosibacterium aquaticum TaxID=2731212 RepID=A0ABX2IJH4_9RHOO|nr:hypothetical protein [Uliginosibacterium aquaticum]NSL56008.1 hypothetical protein [Uliginosibacterium aquaticum]